MKFDAARRLALALPEVEEGSCYGTPGFRVKGRLFARLREDGETLVVGVESELREALIEARPEVFFVTDHYRGHDWVLVRLSKIPASLLKERLAHAWRRVAPKRLAAAHALGGSKA